MSASLEHLRTLLTISRAPSFAAAAEALHVTPSAVSQQMKVLEGTLGANLFEKTGRSLQLTPDATAFVDALRPLFAQIEDAVDGFTGSRDRVKGMVRVAGPDTFCRMWLLPKVAGLLGEYPDLALDVRYLQNDAVEAALVSGDVDLALLVATPEAPSLETAVVFREELLAVASPAYLKARGVPERAVDLDDHRFVIFDPHARILQAWLRGAFGAGAKLRGKVVCSVRSLEQNLLLAEQGVGIAIVPNHLAAASLEAGRVELIDVERRSKSTPNAIHLAWRKSSREAARLRAVRTALLAASSK